MKTKAEELLNEKAKKAGVYIHHKVKAVTLEVINECVNPPKISVGGMIVRIIALPLFALLALIATMRLWLTYCKNYILYGGEAISYTDKMNPKTVHELFNEVQKRYERH